MNIIATIRLAYQFKKVTYYTIHLEDEAESLFHAFINRHNEAPYAESLSIIRAWLKKLGNEFGAQDRFFRFEGYRGGDARALPPPPKYARFIDLEDECPLRLYCMRINDNIVILFGGAEKTANTPQECGRVRPHFLLANRLTPVIDQAIRDGDIRIDEEANELIFDEDLILGL